MTILHATVTRRRPAPPDPAPFQHADALIKAATPDRFDGPIWPLNEGEIDLPTENPPPPPFGNERGDIDAPHFLGSLTAHQRGIPGPLGLDVMLSADGRALEIGPFALDAHNMRWLQRLIGIATAITNPRQSEPPRRSAPPLLSQGGERAKLDSPPFQGGVAPPGAGVVVPESGRGIPGWDLAEGLAEGETRP